MAWSNEVTFKFIELYRSEAAIWNPKNALHKDKNQVNNAWDRISAKMNVPVEVLKKKKETLMAAFRLNHKKKLSSLKTGDLQDVFSPIWLFYDPMAEFLSEVYDYKNGNAYSDDGASSSKTFQEKWNPVIEVGIEDLSNDVSLHEGQSSARKRRWSDSNNPDIPSTCDHLVHTMKTLAKVINIISTEIVAKDKHKDEDECDLYARLTAMKLRQIPEPDRSELMCEIYSLITQRRCKNEPL